MWNGVAEYWIFFALCKFELTSYSVFETKRIFFLWKKIGKLMKLMILFDKIETKERIKFYFAKFNVVFSG